MKAEVLLRRKGENKDADRSSEVSVAMGTQEEQYSPSDFINHLVPDEKRSHDYSPDSLSPVNRHMTTRSAAQTIIRPVPLMPLDSSIYSTPPTYIDNVPSAVNIPILQSPLMTSHAVTNRITLSLKQDTESIPSGSPELRPKVSRDNSLDLLDCKWLNCDQQFTCMDELVTHVNDYHVRVERPDIEYQCKWNGCPRKGKGFNARYKMLIHIRTHTNEKPHKCSRCGKSFSRLENLKIHMRSHTGEKPYICPFEGCKKAYSNSSDRFKHVRTHQEDKPYICKMPGCSKRYTDPSSLRKHVRTHGHHYKGDHVPGLHPKSNTTQNDSIDMCRNTRSDYTVSVNSKVERMEDDTDSISHENPCLRLVNLSNLVSNPLLSAGIIPLGMHAVSTSADLPMSLSIKSLTSDSFSNVGQHSNIRIIPRLSQDSPLDLSTCSSPSASCESEVEMTVSQASPLIDSSIGPGIGRWEIVQMTS